MIWIRHRGVMHFTCIRYGTLEPNKLGNTTEKWHASTYSNQNWQVLRYFFDIWEALYYHLISISLVMWNFLAVVGELEFSGDASSSKTNYWCVIFCWLSGWLSKDLVLSLGILNESVKPVTRFCIAYPLSLHWCMGIYWSSTWTQTRSINWKS